MENSEELERQKAEVQASFTAFKERNDAITEETKRLQAKLANFEDEFFRDL
jgi:hypothetical protein